MILVDTNVVSEFMRVEVDPHVLSWAAGVAPADLAISAVTVQEIEFGLRLLPHGRRRSALERAWSAAALRFAHGIAPYDTDAARAAAAVLSAATRARRPMGVPYAQIAGTCLSRGWALATRNTADFATVDHLTVVNPFALP